MIAGGRSWAWMVSECVEDLRSRQSVEKASQGASTKPKNHTSGFDQLVREIRISVNETPNRSSIPLHASVQWLGAGGASRLWLSAYSQSSRLRAQVRTRTRRRLRVKSALVPRAWVRGPRGAAFASRFCLLLVGVQVSSFTFQTKKNAHFARVHRNEAMELVICADAERGASED